MVRVVTTRAHRSEAAANLRRVLDALDRGELVAFDIDQCDDVTPELRVAHRRDARYCRESCRMAAWRAEH